MTPWRRELLRQPVLLPQSCRFSFFAMTAELVQTSAHLPSLTVSVIIPIYNGERDLPDLIDCLICQTYPANQVEYLFIDNGSRDGTPALLTQAAAQASSLGITCKFIQETAIQSSYAARNAGIRAASGEILAFTDVDCRPLPDWLVQLTEGFEDPQVGLVAGEIVPLDGRHWLERYADRQGFLSQKNTLNHPFCAYGQTANLAIRAIALSDTGLFRPYLTTGGDADICWRLQRQGGWRLHFAETAVVKHRHRSSLKQLYEQWYRYGRSNRYLHQLYATELSRPLENREVLYRLMRWCLKEIPLSLLQLGFKQATWLDLCTTPLDLYCSYARTRGQLESSLPAQAREIDWNLSIV